MNIQDALQKRNWTAYRLAQAIPSRRTSSLYNLLSGDGASGNLSIRTALEVCQALWPDVQLTDLVPDCPFELRPIPGRERELG